MFYCDYKEGANCTRYFSVPSPGGRRAKSLTAKSRVIVVHEGPETGYGTWTCRKDKKTAYECLHVVRARRQLQRLLSGNPNPPGMADLEEVEKVLRPITGT